MAHWNEDQPDGQGLLSDFEVYFLSLTEADKEVSQQMLHDAPTQTLTSTPPQPFKKEMWDIQAAMVFSLLCHV